MKQSVEKGERKVKCEACNMKGSFIICPLVAFVPTEGVFGSLPNLLEMKAQLPNHKRQKRTEGEKDFSGTNPWSSDWKRIWGAVIVVRICDDVPNLTFQGRVSRKVLLDTWSFHGWKLTSFVQKCFSKLSLISLNSNLLTPFCHPLEESRATPCHSTVIPAALISVTLATWSPQGSGWGRKI